MEQQPFPLPSTQIDTLIKQALKDWHAAITVDPAFQHFYRYRQWQQKTGGKAKLALNHFLMEGIKLLQERNEQAAQFLQARYLDQKSMQWIMNQLNLAESTLYALQRQAVTQLAETLIDLEQTNATQQKHAMLDRLGPPGYLEAVGIEAKRQQLQTLVKTSGPPWLIAIEGIGGIGKTTLAHALLQHLIEQGEVDEVGWLSVQQERLTVMGQLEADSAPAWSTAQLLEELAKQLLPGRSSTSPEHLVTALRAHLKEVPHVIVIDNLESLADVETLLPTLQRLTNPTKFILTSRESLFGVAHLYHAKLEELSLPNAVQLIRQEAQICGLPVLATSKDSDLIPIYETVGGNPLALRL
ncbi:MAG: AAA family ATPase, partial [Caldilineaceae bacterium]|nr:AAA family ATPase [Caldilineaceae bacterium]